MTTLLLDTALTALALFNDVILRAALAELMHRNDFSQELPPHCLRTPARAEVTRRAGTWLAELKAS